MSSGRQPGWFDWNGAKFYGWIISAGERNCAVDLRADELLEERVTAARELESRGIDMWKRFQDFKLAESARCPADAREILALQLDFILLHTEGAASVGEVILSGGTGRPGAWVCLIKDGWFSEITYVE